MSVWGKIIGGVAGYVLGGPLGALLGAAFGHAIDRSKVRKGIGYGSDEMQTRQTAFTVAVVVLSAKMAKSDGRVTRDEINAFKKIFDIPSDELREVGRLFDEAKRDAEGFEPYANQIGTLFSHDKVVLENLLGGLFQIALADGVIHPNELEFLENVSREFGLNPTTYKRIRASYLVGEYTDPFEVLGVSQDCSEKKLKEAYHKLIRDNHPDLLIAQGMPQEFIDVANEKMVKINAAYEQIEKIRSAVK